jgi:molecular chaperone GrpE
VSGYDAASGANPAGPTDDDVAVGEIVEDDDVDTADAESRLRADLDEAVAGADTIGQTAEEAVAEAVDVAQRLQVERDELRDLVQRVQADFENYKRRVESQRADQRAQAALDLVRELLPVLDACEAAVMQGHADVAPVGAQLASTLEKQGLSRVADAGVEFDPNIHEAVLHEEGDGEPVVAEVLRAGYLWNQRVVRPAMVKVKG